jgi:hypothetical protein
MRMIFAGLMQRVLLGALAVVASTYIAFAQAGSTGGTLGNTDKSISGDREAPRGAPSTRSRETPQRTGTAASISGKWSWEATCTTFGMHHGSFDVSQITGDQFTGSIVNSDGSTSSISGRVSPKSISFNNSFPQEKWNGTLANGHLSGSVSGTILGGYTCHWTASR